MDNISLAHQDFFDMWHELSNPPLNAKGYNYKYADLPTVLKTIKPVLATYNFAISQQSQEASENEVKIKTVLYHRLYGPYAEATKSMWLKASASDNGKHAQAYGVISTYCRRYSLLEILGIVGEGDTDGVTELPHVQAKPQNSARKPTKINASNQQHVDKVKEYLIETDTLEHLSEIIGLLHGKKSTELPKVVAEIKEKYGAK